MDEKEIAKYKKELMKEVWIENRQRELEQLPVQDARDVVDSMNEKEIYQYVNVRSTQEDYIVDYLLYLWDISPKAFWKHVIVSLDVKKGLLWGGDMPHFTKMCQYKIPDEVLDSVLNFITKYEGDFVQDLEAIGCVVKAQVDKFNRWEEIKEYLSKLEVNSQARASQRIQEMLASPCKYTFD